MTGLLEHTDRHIAGTDDQVHHHGAAVAGTVSIAICGVRRVALPRQQARRLQCCPDCADLLTRPCTATCQETT